MQALVIWQYASGHQTFVFEHLKDCDHDLMIDGWTNLTLSLTSPGFYMSVVQVFF